MKRRIVKKVKIEAKERRSDDGKLLAIGVREGMTQGEKRRNLAAMLNSYMPGNQLTDARFLPGYADIIREDLVGEISLKHARRALPRLNPAMRHAGVDMDKVNFVIDNDEATYDGEILCGREVFKVILATIAGSYRLTSKSTGIPMQVATMMLSASEKRRVAFGHVIADCIGQFEDMFSSMQYDQEWLEKHAAIDVPGLNRLVSKAGTLDSAVTHDIRNSWLKDILESTVKQKRIGDGFEWHTLAMNDALEDGKALVVETENVTGVGIALHINGKFHKGYARLCEDLDDYDIISNVNNIKCGSRLNGIWTLLGTHTKKWVFYNRKTSEILFPKKDGADDDGDKEAIGKRETAAEGLLFRVPLSHHQGLIGIDIQYEDGYVAKANPAGYPWDAPILVELESRPKVKLVYDTNLPHKKALLNLADSIIECWNGADVGSANLALQIGTIIKKAQERGEYTGNVKYNWTDDDLEFMAKIQCFCIDQRKIEKDELKRYYKIIRRIKGSWENGELNPKTGQVVPLFTNRYPNVPVLETDTPLDAAYDEMMAIINECKMDFIDTNEGAPIVPIEVLDMVEVSEEAKIFFDEFNMVLSINKEDIINDTDNAKALRSDFILRARGHFEKQFGTKDKIDIILQLVKLHHYKPRMKKWAVTGWNDKGDWPKTPDQTLIRCFADYICDALVCERMGDKKGLEDIETVYYPVCNSEGEARNQDGLDSRAVFHVVKDKPNKRGFFKYEIHVDGKQIGWVKDKRNLKHYAGRTVNIVHVGGTAMMAVL